MPADLFELEELRQLIEGNKTFVRKTLVNEPKLLKKNAAGQSPEVLWIGCADSRVPETTVCHSKPGDIFVHRNIANVVQADDASSAAVIEFAVAHLKVKRIVVCGHTKCGGANAALGDADLGPTLNRWLEPLRALRRKHEGELKKLASPDDCATRVAEINVHAGVETLKKNKTVAKAMEDRGLTVHGMIFDIAEGELRVLEEKPAAQGLWNMVNR
ncbi:carbonic anhydrase [Lineolata rhizophorae]|uniref:Carbonic anhydrase n=1 Tax=Lineolata rhizophorae TaxID=578093 RepID=A0A6A6P9E6_9PEZI|nr:carbonic anhydrase [Lineolata rhizophorae]